MGTAANKILKDIINRTMQIEGYNAEFVPGVGLSWATN